MMGTAAADDGGGVLHSGGIGMFKFLHTVEKVVMSVLLTAMVVVTFSQVIARYVFNSGTVWALELTVFLFAWLVLLGAAQLAREGRHIGIDALIAVLKPRGRQIAGLIASGASILYALMMLSGAWTYFSKFYRLGIPAKELPIPTWVALLVLPISFAVLALRFGASFMRILTKAEDRMLSTIEDKELIDELDQAETAQASEKIGKAD